MYGAILGDIIGSPYEGEPAYTKDFPLFSKSSHFTDDTVMTIAIAEALDSVDRDAEEEEIKNAVVKSMRTWGNRTNNAGYGHAFRQWLKSDNPQPYGSYGNGSAMRVSAVGWCYDDIQRTREVARWTAEVTHNHPEGIKGAESVAAAIYLARNGKSKAEIKDYIESEFHYDLSRTIEEIRPNYQFEVSCQKSVPESIIAFLESNDFESAVRNAIWLGGDADTQAAIAGSIAWAYYIKPKNLITECRKRLPAEMIRVIDEFEGPPALKLTSDLLNKKFFKDMMYFHVAYGGPYCEGHIALMNAKGELYTGNFLGMENDGQVLRVIDNGLLTKIFSVFMPMEDLPDEEEREKNGWIYFYLGYHHVLYVNDKVVDSFCEYMHINPYEESPIDPDWEGAAIKTLRQRNR